MLFVNFSNHPSEKWSQSQRAAALEYGEIQDVSFPDVSPELDEVAIDRLGREYAEKILEKKPDAVMCQGEYTLSFNVAVRLMQAGVRVLCACSERCTIEIANERDNMRESLFTFVRFRDYLPKGGLQG